MLRRVVSLTVLVVFLVWVGWYVSRNQEAFRPILEVTWLDGVHLVLAFLLLMTANGLFIAIVSSAFGLRLSASEYLSLSFASSFANYFLPLRGGTGIRALYMHHVHGLPVTEFVSTLSVMYVMHSVVNSSLALLGMGLIVAKGGPLDFGLATFLALVCIAGVVVMRVDISFDLKRQNILLQQLARFTMVWSTLRGNRKLLRRLWLLMLLTALATVWQCRAAFDAIAVPLPLGGVMVYAAAKNLAALIGLTPGALGIVEMVSIYLGSVLGYSTADALSVQALIRAVAIFVLLTIGPLAFFYLKRRLSQRDANGREEI